MGDETGYTPEAFRDALGRMADRLVALGYADRVVLEDLIERVTVHWTPAGRTLRIHIDRLFPTVLQGDSALNTLDTMMLLTLFLRTRDGGENPFEGRR